MPRIKQNAIAMFVAIFVLSACASVAPSPYTEVGPVKITVEPERLTSNDFEAILGYTETVRLLSPVELQREYIRVERGYTKNKNAVDRIKLAILLGLRHAPFRDEARARGLLLQTISESGYNTALHRRLASLLLVAMDERRELERSLDDERRTKQALSKKLEQLRTIEEDIDRRRSPAMTPRNGTSRSDTGS